MTEARVEKVYANRQDARTYLDQAKIFQADADADLSGESRSVLLHNAVISAADAIRQAAGLRVSGGEGAHQLRIETALAQLQDETEELLDRLEASRSRRNEASYHAMLVPDASIDEAREATAELIALAEGFIASE
jgi:hypothetical protein